jgi:hypothetical protein
LGFLPLVRLHGHKALKSLKVHDEIEWDSEGPVLSKAWRWGVGGNVYRGEQSNMYTHFHTVTTCVTFEQKVYCVHYCVRTIRGSRKGQCMF